MGKRVRDMSPEQRAAKRLHDRAYQAENRDRVRQQRKIFREKNREKINEQQYRCYDAKREQYNARVRKWKEENAERNSATDRARRLRNLEKYRASGRLRTAKYIAKRKADPSYVLRMRMSARIGCALRRRGIWTKRTAWEIALGYTREDLRRHLEALFLPGMSWENRSEWHVDHILPVASFRFHSMACPGFKACWALKNLQPLWAVDNLRKHARVTPR